MPYDGTQLNETAAHLLRAKRYIEEHGWIQGRVGKDGGPRCIYGAAASTAMWDGAAELLMGRLRHMLGEGAPMWNDHAGRTVEEVYAAFDRAIALALETGE